MRSKLFLATFFTLLIASCSNYPPAVVPKLGTDTVLVAARQPNNSVFLDSAIRTVSKILIPSDSVSTSGKWALKASYRLYQVTGIKMKGKDTVFGPNHQLIYTWAYSLQPVDDSLTPYISVVDLPYHIHSTPDTTKH
jgi:hypothetical protein